MATAAEALQQLQAYQAPDSATVLSQAESKYGIPQLQQKVQDYRTLTGNLTSAISAVDPSVTGRTAGSLVTEGQRSALVSRERAPIVGQLGTAQEGAALVKGDYDMASSKAGNEANATISDNKAKYQRLLDTYNVANEREQTAAKAAAEEAARQESIRQFNVQQATTRGSSSYGGGGGSAASSPAATKAAVTQHVAQGLASSTGKDGKVSNETWAAALSDAVAAGYTPRTFWQQFGQYVNTKYKSSYAGYAQR